MQIVSNESVCMKWETICMKWKTMFSGKNKENIINLSFAEFAHRVVKVKSCALYFAVTEI